VREGPEELLNRSISIVGSLPDVEERACYDVRLTREVHHHWGEQYRVVAAMKAVPKDHRSLERYLVKVMPKIGVARARYIIDAFGESTVAVLDSEDAENRLVNEANIPRDAASEALREWRTDRDRRDTELLLLDAGIPMRQAAAIVDYFAPIPITEIIATDPYQMMLVPQVSFRQADQVALNSGVRGDDSRRLYAGAAHVAGQKTREGHCYTPIDDLVAATSTLLGQPPQAIINALEQPTDKALLVIDAQQRCWPLYIIRAEKQTASGLERLRSMPSPITYRLIDKATPVPAPELGKVEAIR
jgi:exodeoxyribonuclease V alpha subunit